MNSAFGIRWKIDGINAGPIRRSFAFGQNGQYDITFERCYTSLEEIETINWSKPTIEYVWPHSKKESGLPEGYGFSVVKIDYDSGGKFYRVTVKTESQYLGDVTGYQAQIDDLKNAAVEKDSTISTQASQIQEQAATIEEQAATIQTLQESGSAAELEAELDAAYEEGVNSVE